MNRIIIVSININSISNNLKLLSEKDKKNSDELMVSGTKLMRLFHLGNFLETY